MPVISFDPVTLDDGSERAYVGGTDSGCAFAPKCLECPFAVCLMETDEDEIPEGEPKYQHIQDNVLRCWEMGDRNPRLAGIWFRARGATEKVPLDVADAAIIAAGETPIRRTKRLWTYDEDRYVTRLIGVVDGRLIARSLGIQYPVLWHRVSTKLSHLVDIGGILVRKMDLDSCLPDADDLASVG